MGKIAIVTDSNSGITQAQGRELGIHVVPMPFYIDGELYFEDLTLTQAEFYQKLMDDADISTSMPAVGDVMELWDRLLQENDEIVYIPMSSGLSSSCETAMALSREYDGKVQVVNNQRISITQRRTVLDAKELAGRGMDAAGIREYLEKTKYDSSIYITLDTLKYLKKGGRITPAAAALGTLLRLKPVLQIQGEKLDAFAKCRTLKAAKNTMLDAIAKDFRDRFQVKEDGSCMWIDVAYSGDDKEAQVWKEEVQKVYPDHEIVMNPLSLSVSCHIGPGSIAIACSKKLPEQI
ncbi:MAG: DegV family protein [Lachnospiraceae bacterium]|nr:DegV family protein [Lachnospiraceae bacterium]